MEERVEVRNCPICQKILTYVIKNNQNAYTHRQRLLKNTLCNDCSHIRFTVNDDFLDEINPLQAWFLGFMAADGSVGKNYFSISQSHDAGLQLLKTIKQFLSYTGNISIYKKSYRLQITSKRLVENLSKFNIVPRKSLIYEYPNNLDDKLFRYFLRGYIDGDGSVGFYFKKDSKSHHLPILIASFVGTPMFIDECVKRIPFNNYSLSEKSSIKEFRFNGWKAVEFLKWLYQESYNIPKYYKQEIFEDYLEKYPITEFHHYLDIETKAKALINDGISVNDVANRLGVGWRHVYTWKARNFINPTYASFIKQCI